MGIRVSRSVTAHAVAGWRRSSGGSQQIDIGTLNQLTSSDAQLRHESLSLGHARLGGFTLSQHHLEFEKVPEAFNAVEVHAGAPHQEQLALLAHASRLFGTAWW